jgi:hypothetical protein
MNPTLKEIIASLKTGDLLVIPFHNPDIVPQDKVFAAVLRTDADGLYLSMFSPGELAPIPYVPGNPFRWDDQAGTLVDRNGEAPEWYYLGIDIRVEPGGARKVAEEYAVIPRLEHLTDRVTKQDMLLFKSTDPRFARMSGVAINGDVSRPMDQVSLMLDMLGIACTHEQRVGACWMLELITRQMYLHAAVIAP